METMKAATRGSDSEDAQQSLKLYLRNSADHSAGIIYKLRSGSFPLEALVVCGR